MTDEQKTIAFVVYPGLTPLDLVGPLQVLSVLAQLDRTYRTVVVGATKDTVGTDTPLRIAPSHTFDEVPSPSRCWCPAARCRRCTRWRTSTSSPGCAPRPGAPSW